jgi:hypothetical protein
MLLGTGVQNIEIDGGTDFDQIYASFGLGIKTKLTDRIVLSVEGKNTQYKMRGRICLKRIKLFLALQTLILRVIHFPIGQYRDQYSFIWGRRPGSLSELDRAYLQKFKGGFKVALGSRT